jgi:alkylhydroperoxidase family enzyme
VSRHWFDGGNPLTPVKPGTLDERQKARHGAAQLVVRHGGTAQDLHVVLSALGLWPSSDP